MASEAKKNRVGGYVNSAAAPGIPNTFRYNKDVQVGIESVHSHYIEIFPSRTGIYASGSQIQFIIPAAKMLDFTRAAFYFRGNVTIATGTATWTQFPRPIGSIFKNFQTEWQQKAETIVNYGQISTILERFYDKNVGCQLNLAQAYTSSPDASGSMVSRCNNDLPSANRQFSANGSKYYLIGLHIGHLTRKVFPMGIMSSPLYFYIDLDTDLNVLETDAAPSTTQGSYTIDDLRILIPQYDLPSFYANQLLRDAQGGVGLVIPYPLWRYQSDSLAASTGGEKRITINTVCRNLEHVIVGWRRTANITTEVKADKIACFERPSDLQYYYALINGERIPRFNIRADDEGLQSFWFSQLGRGKFHSYTSSTDTDGLAGYSRSTWTATDTVGTWLAHFDFDDFPQDEELLSGISTSDQNGRLELVFQFGSSGPAANMTIDIWLLMRQVYCLHTSPNGTMLEIEFPGQGS